MGSTVIKLTTSSAVFFRWIKAFTSSDKFQEKNVCDGLFITN